MFTFGVLKFVSPFRDWYTVQVTMSGLPVGSFTMGIFSEIVIGFLLFGSYLFWPLSKYGYVVLQLGSAGLVGMMCVATYVHLHPSVPADVLPLKIKPPAIPLMFLALAVFNAILAKMAGSRNLAPSQPLKGKVP
jgi:hypothetical protein